MFNQEIRKGYEKFISGWNWELFATLTFPSEMKFSNETAFRRTTGWLKKINTEYPGIRFAGIIFYTSTYTDFRHVHCMLISDPSYPKRLRQIPPRELEALWKHSCQISRNNHRIVSIAEYIASIRNMNLYDQDRWDMQFYRKNLLYKLKRKD